jgi:hypothetical protein
MKRTLLITTLVLFTASTATAVTNYDGPEDKPHIMGSGSTASGSTAVGPNGTQYTSKVAMDRRISNITNESVTQPVFKNVGDKTRVEFNGSITSLDLCHVIDQETESANGTYKINIKTVKEKLNSDGICGQAQTMIEYTAEFEAERPYDITVLHNGEEMETFTAEEDIAGPEPEPRKRGFIGSVVDFFTGLF